MSKPTGHIFFKSPLQNQISSNTLDSSGQIIPPPPSSLMKHKVSSTVQYCLVIKTTRYTPHNSHHPLMTRKILIDHKRHKQHAIHAQFKSARPRPTSQNPPQIKRLLFNLVLAREGLNKSQQGTCSSAAFSLRAVGARARVPL